MVCQHAKTLPDLTDSGTNHQHPDSLKSIGRHTGGPGFRLLQPLLEQFPALNDDHLAVVLAQMPDMSVGHGRLHGHGQPLIGLALNHKFGRTQLFELLMGGIAQPPRVGQ